MLNWDKYFNISLVVSIIVHVMVFLPFPRFGQPRLEKVAPSLEITYLVIKPPPKKVAAETPPPPPTSYEKKLPPKAELTKTKEISLAKRQENRSAAIEIPPELPKDKEELYIDYYRSIRERIRSFVEKNYTSFIDYGEVCLYFVLLSNGQLKQINIVNERSSDNPQLKEIVKRSLSEAAPFFPFPPGLNSEQLSFNVTVSFEMEE